MKAITKFAAKAALVGSLALGALAAAAPANAGVVVGVGIGGPGYHRHYCYHHPYACRGPVYAAGPRIGVFYGGRGWWDGHRYWGHRYRFHGGWRYR